MEIGDRISSFPYISNIFFRKVNTNHSINCSGGRPNEGTQYKINISRIGKFMGILYGRKCRASAPQIF